jgi:hypothetical protein
MGLWVRLCFNTIRPYGKRGKGQMGFGREVILGLLAEEPSNCYQLDRRLTERFGSARYTHGRSGRLPRLRAAPVELGETGEVAVEGDELASMFEGDRRELRVGDEIP